MGVAHDVTVHFLKQDDQDIEMVGRPRHATMGQAKSKNVGNEL